MRLFITLETNSPVCYFYCCRYRIGAGYIAMCSAAFLPTLCLCVKRQVKYYPCLQNISTPQGIRNGPFFGVAWNTKEDSYSYGTYIPTLRWYSIESVIPTFAAL